MRRPVPFLIEVGSFPDTERLDLDVLVCIEAFDAETHITGDDHSSNVSLVCEFELR